MTIKMGIYIIYIYYIYVRNELNVRKETKVVGNQSYM